jgi:cobalt-zinc-cadmium efflux system protein
MGAGHDHGAGQANARRLTIALALTSTFLVAEVIAGLAFNSLALLSDAAHMFTDAAALAIALAAIRIGRRKPTDTFTFGYRRFEILAAAFNAVLLFAVAIYVLVEGIKRIVEPEPVQSMGMLVVAVLGLGINLSRCGS